MLDFVNRLVALVEGRTEDADTGGGPRENILQNSEDKNPHD